ILTPGYFCSFSKGSAGQSDRRRSSHNPKRAASGPVAFSKHGSLTRPIQDQRLSRLAFNLGYEEIAFNRSSVPTLSRDNESHRRSFPPVHRIHVLRPFISLAVNCSNPLLAAV